MGTITSGVGLVSGINYKTMIDQLMAIEQRPKDLLQKRVDSTNNQKLAFTDLATRLTGMRLSATTLKKASTFLNRLASSSNEAALTVSAASGAAKGTYQFQVSRLVSSQQAVSAGFANTTTEAVGAGTISLELGGGEIDSETSLSQLNGGSGVQRGQFRITDRSGRTGVVDISSSLSLDDVVRKINTSLDISVKATIQDDKLVLTDLTGQTSSNLIVTDLGGGSAATNLGIAGSFDSATLTGSVINYLGRANSLASLNDGRGVRTASAGADFRITSSTGTTYEITTRGLSTVGQVLDAINTATGGAVTASIAGGATGITLTDSGGGSPLVEAIGTSMAAQDLGINATALGNTISGRSVLAGVNTVLLSSLRGGKGLNLGTVAFTDRAGATTSIDFSAATDVRDVLDLINNNGVAGLKATLKDSGNGIQITDTTGGSGDIIIADSSSTTAAELGIAGTFTTATPTVKGANLQRQWVGENTLLSTYNGGRGVTTGKFTINNSLGGTATIDITTSDTTIGDVLRKINATGIGVTASINDNGDGILLTDNSGGGASMIVADTTSQTAANLNISGTATGNTLNGSFEKNFSITGTDTLDSVIAKLNDTAFAVSASTINDGSGATANRLSLTSRFSGRAGRFVFDAGDTRLQTSNLVKAQDAAVFFGGSDSQQPVLISSSTNQLTGVVRGLTLNLNGVSAGPVTVNISDSNSVALEEVKKFVSSFNELTDKMSSLTAYNEDSTKRGILMGDGTVEQIQNTLYSAVQSVVKGAGTIRLLADVGLKIVDGAKLELDEDKFQQAYAKDPENFKRFFTQFQAASGTTPAQKGMGTIIEEAINKLIDPSKGVLTVNNKTLDNRTQSFQDRIAQLDTMLAAKRLRLETQYSHLESVLATMQTQQQAITSFTNSLSKSSSSSNN